MTAGWRGKNPPASFSTSEQTLVTAQWKTFKEKIALRDFTKVSPSLWHSERFNSLKSDDARLAFLYILTSEHQNSAGCYRLPDAYAAADLRWSVERFQKARFELAEADLIVYDMKSSVVMVRNWFHHNPPMNPKHRKGIQLILERLPSQLIWQAANSELDQLLAPAAAYEPVNHQPHVQTKSWENCRPKKQTA